MATVAGLDAGTSYSVVLYSVNDIGVSPLPSNAIVVTTAMSGMEVQIFYYCLFYFLAPRLSTFVATPIDGGRTLLIEWIVHTGGSPVTSFSINITSSLTTQILTPDINAGRIIVYGLEPQTEYVVMFEVSNVIGSQEGSIDSPVMTPRGPPGKPTKPSVGSVSTSSVELMFQVPSKGSETIDYYLVNITSGDRMVQHRVEADDDSDDGVTVLVDNLESGEQYYFKVAAGGVLGHGEFSDLSDSITTS